MTVSALDLKTYSNEGAFSYADADENVEAIENFADDVIAEFALMDGRLTELEETFHSKMLQVEEFSGVGAVEFEFPEGYDSFVFEILNLTQTSTAYLMVRTTPDGVNYDSNSSDYHNSVNGATITTDAGFLITANSAPGNKNWNGHFKIYDPEGITYKACNSIISVGYNTPGRQVSGGRTTQAAVLGCQFSISAGTMAGKITMFGVNSGE